MLMYLVQQPIALYTCIHRLCIVNCDILMCPLPVHSVAAMITNASKYAIAVIMQYCSSSEDALKHEWG